MVNQPQVYEHARHQVPTNNADDSTGTTGATKE